jgi:hypothetical protein
MVRLHPVEDGLAGQRPNIVKLFTFREVWLV